MYSTTVSLKFFVLSLLVLSLASCKNTPHLEFNFDQTADRVWLGEDFWPVPMEDWAVSDGRIVFSGEELQSRVNLLSAVVGEQDGNFKITVETGLQEKGETPGSVGFAIGVKAKEDDNIRAACYFGNGAQAGINTGGFAFIGQKQLALPEDFNWEKFRIELNAEQKNNSTQFILSVRTFEGEEILSIENTLAEPVNGIVQLVNNFRFSGSEKTKTNFWFDNLKMEGSKLVKTPENRFGPILWAMYTQSHDIVKLTAQLPPIGKNDEQKVKLQLEKEKQWADHSEETIDPDARTATFRLENWDPTVAVKYRLVYINNGNEYDYIGTIQRDPVDRPLKMGALTCQEWRGFPYSPLVKNLTAQNPDILYFSGDQIYEGNGGYPIKRQPIDASILSYLGKWYMFGWTFGDIMRDRPTICTPDDHDVFHGNLWGDSGGKIEKWRDSGDQEGFAQSAQMVNVVNRTQCEHLPDPFDPTPIQQGMSVWYTTLNYGRVSFAIISDRIFKSGPEQVANWEGRKDHILAPLKDPKSIEKPGLQFLGERQERFLKHWIKDWNDVDMKVLLSQTVFANSATHHGTFDGYLYGDMDSGGWPKSARDKALKILRKAFVFQIAGDQHLPSLQQYGIDEYQDGSWCYCTPAISVGYQRWFRPDELGFPIKGRPDHQLPNTGHYKDAFGNLNFIYAVGNPGKREQAPDRYKTAQLKASGYGIVEFDQHERTIFCDAIRFLADAETPRTEDHFPGWPFTISQFDNDGREVKAWLPNLKIEGEPNPVIELINEKNAETESIVRIKGNNFSPKVFSNDSYTIRIGYPETDKWKELKDVKASAEKPVSELSIQF
jgi:hypothetical protein